MLDGKIFNSDQLHQNLLNSGVIFSTNLDEELTLYGHILYGENFVKNNQGKLSIIIGDSIEYIKEKHRFEPNNNIHVYASNHHSIFLFIHINI